MRVYILIIAVLLYTESVDSQVEKGAHFGSGINVSYKGSYGFIGLSGHYFIPRLNDRLELNLGLGLNPSGVFGGGAKLRTYDNGVWFEAYIGLNYSYQLSGEFMFEIVPETTFDYYSFTSTQNLYYYTSCYFWFDKEFSLKIDIGYRDNISGFNVNHISGPDEKRIESVNRLKSDLFLGVGIMMFIKNK